MSILGGILGAAASSALSSLASRKKKSNPSAGSSSGNNTGSTSGNTGGLGGLYGSVANPFSPTNPMSLALTGLSALMGANRYQQQPQYEQMPYPEMPDMNLRYPSVDYISYDDALRQARERLNPQFASSRNNLLTTFQQEKKRLPQQLNARGQLRGGLMEGGEEELTQRQAMALEQLALQSKSAEADLAAAIQAQDQQRAQSIADRRWAQMQANAQNALAKWRTDVDNVWRENDSRRSAMQQLVEYQREQQKAALDAQEAQQDREFDVWKTLLPYQQMTPYQQASLSLRNTGGGGGGSGGGSVSAPGPTTDINPTTAVKNAKVALSSMKDRGYGMQSAIEFARATILPTISGADSVARDKAWNSILEYLNQLYNVNTDPLTAGRFVDPSELTSPGEY